MRNEELLRQFHQPSLYNFSFLILHSSLSEASLIPHYEMEFRHIYFLGIEMHSDTFGLQRVGERRGGFIVATHLVPVGPKPARQRRHANAANAEKEYVGKLLQNR